ncbi:MAG: peptidoglycan-binding protein, partial [Christensenellaceae bacterium]
AQPTATVSPSAQPTAAVSPSAQPTAAVSPSAQPTAAVSPSAQPTAAVPILNEKQQLFTADILPGTTSNLISVIQSRLMELHYMEEDNPTELYGPLTEQGIRFFQRKSELEMTGIATLETLHLLMSDAAKPYTVSIGADGVDVEEIQKRLENLGYPTSVTGYFGTDTQTAVIEFQKMNNLTDDGNVGMETKEALYSDKAKESNGQEKGSSSKGGTSGGSGAQALIDVAYQQLGKPYVLGAKGPSAFDCSGLVYYCLNQSGYDIGYMTSGGWANSGYTHISSMDDLQKGDILTFKGHVGIYIGGGQMIDASSSEGQIRVSGDIGSTAYWVNNWKGARRLF